MDDQQFESRAIHGGARTDEHGSVMSPVHVSTTYEYETPAETRGDYRYARMASPTRDELEAVVADLEGGDHASAFASGMAAIDAVLATLSPGDHVVAAKNLYAETHDLLTTVYAEYGVETTRVDVTDAAAIESAVRPGTALVYLETPTNPVLNVADVAAAAEAAGAVDARLAVDNTFASPYLQRPLELGADVVVESLTKYVAGHSDVIAGAVATDDPAVAEEISTLQYMRGAIPGPHECFLAVRGARTLPERMDRHCRNARAVVEWLDDHPRVETVYYPGLASHPNHDVAREQMDDFGGMASFELDAGVEAASEFAANLDLVALAESLGGVESLVEQPAVMTHQDLSPAELRAAGIGESLLRLSVGTEHPDDILADLDGAMEETFR